MVDSTVDGASPSTLPPLNLHMTIAYITPFVLEELLFASCRQNNVDLLQEALSNLSTPSAVGDFINKSLDPLGNTALHVASRRGSLDLLDILLDQEGVEVDPRNRMEGDTPLHSAARLSADDNDETGATGIIEMLLDAGADPRYAESPLTG
jgi:uncharacterized protein